MPKIKDLFNKHDSSGKVLSAKNINDLTSSQDAESFGYIEAYQEEKIRFIPEVDFSKPETFVRYGSAEKYYENSIQAIYRTYPYDGSHKEKTEWHNSASHFDNYIFNQLYPRTNGYLNLEHFHGLTGGSLPTFNDNPGTGVEAYFRATLPLYIKVKGGPNKASVADDQDQTEKQTYSKPASKTSYTSTSANIYDVNKKRASNLAIGGADGNTVEFWFKTPNVHTAINKAFFDAWNDDGTIATAIHSASYGRMLLESRAIYGTPNLVNNAAFHFTYMSGTTGAERVPVLVDLLPALNTWNHIAVSVKNSGNQLNIKTYLNGELKENLLTGSSISEVTGAINANIAGYRTFPSLGASGSATTAGITGARFEGFSNPSGSIDEFRFWKAARSSKEIGRNWFTQVYGGSNVDNANTDLGVYFKFNEGTTGNSTYDSVVLDYSGRISNGQIQNYSTNLTDHAVAVRQAGSAMVESSASLSEFKDPIIYSFHPKVSALLADKKEEGGVYDARNSSAIHTTLPNWMSEDDKEVGASNLVKIIQIMASYFDTLQLQLDFLPRVKDVNYTKYSHLKAMNYSDEGSILSTGSDYYPSYSSSYDGTPAPFIKNALESFGLDIPEIFTSAEALENLRSRDEDREYKEKIYNVKNQIYQNIYNNMSFILKSKGTEKSFRNLVRCFGVDDELVRLNLYGNNVDFEIKNNFRSTAVKKSYIDFMDVDRQGATVYMMTSSVNNNTNAYSYIPSNSIFPSGGLGMTFETEINFPYKGHEGDAYYQPFTQLTSSLFGMHTAVEATAGTSGQANTTWNNPDVSEFKVYAIRSEKDSQHVYFQLTSSAMGINLTSSIFDYVYDNEKWNFAVRIKPTKYPWANALTGTNAASLAASVTANTDLTYEVSFYGAHSNLDVIVDEFSLSSTVNANIGDNFMSGSKRLYIGAHRTNFTGGLLQESDVKISTTRAWADYLTDEEMRAHARDADSKGVLHPYKNAFVFQNSLKPYDIPRSDLLIFEWDFTNVTGSDAGISGLPTTYDARFVVEDISSGSTTSNFAEGVSDDRYGGLRNIVRNQFTGRGDFFEPNNTKVVDYIYAHSAKQDAPEIINSSDMIDILNQDDLEFTRESRPIDYFYAVEKSMYQTISDEMLRVFATISDFNNLIGEPVNRYRGQYKDMDKLKSLFFESIGNSPDLDKYVDFYKWLDASITKFLEQLFPASANYADELRTVVESHVLERNAYRNKFPTLEIKQEDPEVPALGINELTYNWKFGHAPTDTSLAKTQRNNCLWFNQRAERTIPALSSSVASVNTGKQTILDVSTTDNTGSYIKRYEGSTYVLRKLSKPYKEGVSFSKQIKGGVNFDANKDVHFWKNLYDGGYMSWMDVSSPGADPFLANPELDDSGKTDKECFDNRDINPLGKNKLKMNVLVKDSVQPVKYIKGNIVLPFNLYTPTAMTGFPADLSTVGPNSYVNIQHDGYGELAEVPMQGPFPEKYVGGSFHRHVRLTTENDFGKIWYERPEAYLYNVGNFSIVTPDDMVLSSTGPYFKNSYYFRDFIAKRPVVIKNILQTTASVDTRLGGTLFHGSIGNYSHQHDIVQTSGRKANNKYFVEQKGVGFGKVFSGLEASPQVAFYNIDYKFPTPERKATDTVFVERFSAPGSFEAMSRGFLDPFAEEMSAYNAMPFRNLSVRGDRFKKIGARKGGGAFGSTTLSDYDGRTLTITSQQNNKTVVYIFLTSGTTGDLDGSGRVKVVLSGSSEAAYVVQLMAAINSANGHNGGVPNSVLGLTSTVAGSIAILGLLHIETTAAYFYVSTINAAQVEMSANTWSTSSLGLRSLLSRHMLDGSVKGYDSEETTVPAFHKTYRNKIRKMIGFTDCGWNFRRSFDNAYVTHMIPRTDFQYSWIRSSRGHDFGNDYEGGFGDSCADSLDIPLYFGYAPYSGEVVSKNGNGFVSAIDWTTSSDVGIVGEIVSINTFGYSSKYAMATFTPAHANQKLFLPIDFAGLNYAVVADSTKFSENTIELGFNYGAGDPNTFLQALAGAPIPYPALILNSGLLNGGGIYGYSTFKQIRNMYHPIARNLKDTNTYSLSILTPRESEGSNIFTQTVFPKLNYKTRGSQQGSSYNDLLGNQHSLLGAELIIENHIEPPLSSKFKPMRHNINVITEKNEIAPMSIDHTYTNNYDFFANPSLMNRMNEAGRIEDPGLQIYDNLLEYTVKGTIPPKSNPIKGIRNLVYKEVIYPKEQHTYLAKTRGRTSYTEDITSPQYTASLGQQRTFWKDSLADRLRTEGAARNALGYIVNNSEFATIADCYGITVELPVDLSVHPLDVGDRVPSNSRRYGQLTGSNHGQLSIDAFQNSMAQYLRSGRSSANLTPTASFNYEYHNFISSSATEGLSDGTLHSEFLPNWDTARLSGKKPWFDSYEEYASDIRLMGQDCTVLPEFRISQHMDHYLDKGFFGFNAKNNRYLTLEGGYLSQSATTETSNFDENFFDIYTHSDFLKHFDVIREQHDQSGLQQTKITISCKAIKKLLPYNGFYPMNRTVQLGHLMSQSFAPYLSGSNIYSADPNVERVSSFMQPFFSPGILYNTIKSGLAVDWMAYTGSQIPQFRGGYGGQTLHGETGSFRLPFESIVDPQNYLPSLEMYTGSLVEGSAMYYLDTRLICSNHRVSGAYAQWTGKSKPNYSMAMNNFLAEVPNFFLKDGKFGNISSLPVASFHSGTTYTMDLDLYKTDDLVMYEGPYSMPLTSAINDGVGQARGIHYGPLHSARASGRTGNSVYMQENSFRMDPAPAAWTPPYFYGKSTVRFVFNPHEFTTMAPNDPPIEVGEGENAFSLSEVVSFIATSGTTFYNDYSLDQSGYLQAGLNSLNTPSPKANTAEGALATKNQMQIYATMNLFNIVERPKFTFNPFTGEKVSTSGTSKHWVISPKFECPVLNFSGNVGTVFAANNLNTRGMWRGYGELPSSGQGIFYNIRESTPALKAPSLSGDPLAGATYPVGDMGNFGSLKEKLFPQGTTPKRVGELADEKEIFEAIVAIPFSVLGNKKVFYPLIPAEDKIVEKTKGRHVVDGILGNREPMDPNVYKPGQSIVDQIERMQKYVIPPSLDFIKNENMAPFQMYIFEFSHTLDKQDLSDIWQGVMPKISVKAEQQTSKISHFLTNNELLLGKPITDEVRWMVFKVKQRAEYSYDKLKLKSVGGGQFISNEIPLEEPLYSYNWPYDFFSLVELAKITTGIQLGGEVPITPPSIDTEPAPPINDPPKKKNPDLSQIAGLTPADNKRANIPQGENENVTEQEIETKLFDISKTPLV